MRIRLRYLLAAAFTLIATVPVIFLGAWVQRTSLEKELAAVEEKHLLLAGNITLALERYARDSEAVFNLFVDEIRQGDLSTAFTEMASQLGFREFQCLDGHGVPVDLVPVAGQSISPIPPAVFQELTKDLGDEVTFSRVMNDSLGRPVIYLIRRLSSERYALGALDSAYIVRLQKAIAFGRKGHAAIIDQFGNLIAHPKPEWQSTHKNIAKLEPVRRMMAGEKGVATFYSPAMEQDMISGFNAVKGPGWGVMVPQPLVELEERAADVQLIALVLSLIGLAVAAAISWFLAGLLTRPLQAVAEAAGSIARGRLDARVETGSAFLPLEIGALADGFNGMARTIEEDKAKLLQAFEELQLADRAKTEFLASMSHELRTPLNAIIGFAETIDAEIYGKIGDERYRGYARNIQDSGKHLLAIINDILELSKIEAGKLEIEDGVIDSDAMIRSALMLVDNRARQAEVKVHFERLTALPALRGAEVKLKQALVNLLSNAVRFTAPGGSVTLSAWQENSGSLGISIADNGIGMSREEIEIALTPFRQVDSRLSRRYDGAGLGLPLAQRLVEMHGGSLEIDSVPGEGTTVTLRFDPDWLLHQAA